MKTIKSNKQKQQKNILKTKQISLLMLGSYSLSCVLPIIIGTVPYRRNMCASVVCQMMPSQISSRQDGNGLLLKIQK
jgi:hypothetical protein